jgi:hypothetical protein
VQGSGIGASCLPVLEFAEKATGTQIRFFNIEPSKLDETIIERYEADPTVFFTMLLSY